MTFSSTAVKAGRALLSVALLATIAAQVGFTWLGWTGAHIFNSGWHPHARFHAAQLFILVVALSLGGLWLVWRRSSEPRLAARVVAAVLVVVWGSEFLAWAVPGTSPSPVLTAPNTFRLFGTEIYGNLFFSGLLIIVSLLGGVLASQAAATSPSAAAGDHSGAAAQAERDEIRR